MKILISPQALQRHANQQPRHAGFTQTQIDWRKKLGELCGQWVTVETQYLFEDQFNIVENNLRVDWTLIDGVEFEEIESRDKFLELVQQRYDVDWPGHKINTYYIDAIMSRQGLCEHPSVRICRERGYDDSGNPIKTHS